MKEKPVQTSQTSLHFVLLFQVEQAYAEEVKAWEHREYLRANELAALNGDNGKRAVSVIIRGVVRL